LTSADLSTFIDSDPAAAAADGDAVSTRISSRRERCSSPTGVASSHSSGSNHTSRRRSRGIAPAPNARHDILLESKQKNRRAVNPMEPAIMIICVSLAGMPAGTTRRLRWMSKGSLVPTMLTSSCSICFAPIASSRRLWRRPIHLGTSEKVQSSRSSF